MSPSKGRKSISWKSGGHPWGRRVVEVVAVVVGVAVVLVERLVLVAGGVGGRGGWVADEAAQVDEVLVRRARSDSSASAHFSTKRATDAGSAVAGVAGPGMLGRSLP